MSPEEAGRLAGEAWHATHRAWYGPGPENTWTTRADGGKTQIAWRWPERRQDWTAADFARAWREVLDAALATAQAYEELARVEALRRL